MQDGPRAFEALEQESHRIVGMICSETVPTAEIDAAIAALRRRTAEEFPERPRLFDETFGRRFSRLRTRFHPTAGLLPTVGGEPGGPSTTR
jgi:hypothetical protein